MDANKNTNKVYYDPSLLAPYLATEQAIKKRVDVSESSEGNASEADAAAGSVLRRVSSFSILARSPPAHQSSSALSQVTNKAAGNREEQEERLSDQDQDSLPIFLQLVTPSWRLRDRMKTVAVGLVMALNVGTDPPDITKPHPCAKLQCWMDPFSVTPRSKAKEKIGDRLEAQYAKWQYQQRAARQLKFRQALDPTVEDVRGLCMWLRRQARQERILFHYNGHGVPRPTINGEIWVFDKNHTQYIPLCVPDLRHWLGKPSIIVLDCSSAGVLIPFFTSPLPEESPVITPAASQEADNETASSQLLRDTIVLCATSANEWLPMHPDYPADLFTSCLTTPIQIALRWFVRRNPQSMGGLSPEAVDAIPGKANDRKTPLGELNWIFTAVTDSIAWNVLPKPLFQRLFRQDLLVSSMFRNFLLADRILQSFHCTPQSYPALPPGLATHPLWEAWDLACETCLFGLIKDGILSNHVLVKVTQANVETAISSASGGNEEIRGPVTPDETPQNAASAGPASSVSSPFFSEQLTAFEIWLDFATVQQSLCQKSRRQLLEPYESPEQLPVVLQVLLSQVHRVRALSLLRRFLGLGPWAVNLSLTLGIYPYVMKLLQSPEYKSLLVNIWTSVLSFDASCQADLVKDGALPHFIHHLTFGLNKQASTVESGTLEESAEQRTMAAFILAATCHNYPHGQAECIRQNVLGTCTALLTSIEKQHSLGDELISLSRGLGFCPEESDLLFPPCFRMWLCLGLGNLVSENEACQTEAIASGVHHRLRVRLEDSSPEVRAAACFALGCLVGRSVTLPAAPANAEFLSSNRSTLSTPTEMSAVTMPNTGSFGQQRSFDLTTASADSRGITQTSPHGLQPSFVSSSGVANTQWYSPYNQSSLIHASAQIAANQPGFLQRPKVHFQGQSDQMHQGHQPVNMLGPPLRPQILAPGFYTPDQAHRSLPLLGVPPSGGRPIADDGPQMFAPGNLPFFKSGRAESVGQITGFDDRARLDWDLSVVEWLLESSKDPSPLVRYETTISLAGVVGKYLTTFLAAAESMLGPTGAAGDGATSAQTSSNFLTDVNSTDIEMIRPTWKVLRFLQRTDPHPCVASAANAVVSVVHEQLLRMKMDSTTSSMLASNRRFHGDVTRFSVSRVEDNLLSGIKEEPDHLVVGQQQSKAPSLSYLKHPSESQPSMSDVPPHRAGQILSGEAPLRRVSSGYAGRTSLQPISVSTEQGALSSHQTGAFVVGNSCEQQTQYSLPKSKLYEWKKVTFTSDPCRSDGVDPCDPDPLDPKHASQSYRDGRKWLSRRVSAKLVEDFASLYPKPPKPKRTSIEMILHDDDESSSHKTEEEASSKKKELELNESKLFKNKGAKMTSILKFHAYEDVLMACDAQDGIALWDCEKGALASAFLNGNAKGSRITTGMWINEASSSAFLVGCDDGSVRVWGDLLEDNGKPSQRPPLLCSAFFAAPDLMAGGRGSGLICEWQQFSGCLLAGGNSKWIRCWDIGAEKFKTKLEVPRAEHACVTTITTAWDFDSLGDGTSSGYQGIGPDIVVTGHSDGSIRVFDIRSNQPPSDLSRRDRSRRRMPTEFLEHESWIVDTSFTGYGTVHEILSGSVSGDVKAWDLRVSLSVRTLEAQRSTMTALAFHGKIPIFATGSHAQFIKVMSLDGDTLQVFRNHQGMGGIRIGPVSCVEFHPHKLLLAAGATDDLISLYVPKNQRVER
jgi:WD40 repeat protein